MLQDVWVDVALNDIERAKHIIDAVPEKNPFEIRYQENISNINWESWVNVLDNSERRKKLLEGW